MDPQASSDDPATAAEISILSAIASSEYEGPDQLQSYNVAPPESGYSPVSGRHRWSWSLKGEEQDTSSNTIADPPGIASWPRRLLHIPTWTSYEWEPGHIYGSHREPEYSAISYTWGRFRLDSQSKSKALRRIRGIPISNCPWKIPPIDPSRFSGEEFRTVLRRTAEATASDTAVAADFVWLDVACIDQNWGSEDGQLEVGRQAEIFRGAQMVTIWLTNFTYEALNHHFVTIRQALAVLDGISPAIVASEQMAEERDGNLSRARSAIDAICKDPWFSSLWTLQEAFLCPKAYFMSRDGHFCEGLADDQGPATLQQLSSTAQHLGKIVRGFLQAFGDRFDVQWAKMCWEIEELIRQKGFPALNSRIPMILYAAAGKRTAKYDFDYVYGIQQVFGFRLGNSRPGSTKRTYSRAELQAHMGSALIDKYPVQSQMHVFSMPVEDGQGWSISLSSRIPEAAGWEDLRDLLGQDILSSCIIRAEDHPDGGAVGYFEGNKCSFTDFYAATPVKDRVQRLNDQSYTSFMIGLDTIRNTIGEPPQYRTWGKARDIPRGKEQGDLSSWLVAKYLEEEFIVLRLGRAAHELPMFKRHIGLLLLSIETQINGMEYWKRIGFVIWNDSHDDNIRIWRDICGFFG